ncbi:hypothetical protein sr10104 [Sporisorium reilianum SRZ2]|uniref:Uncharacterized protein n=1 Tax=Sporisorium reilianum (strain SRZ2) TaxID=999809 RepID=E6ZKJ4_SPORE|nr:hypothetical protein sr10104 [Sporisorium reilianum SRZ2]
MFFDGIGIDLHFLHEGNIASPSDTAIFGAYQNAAQGLDNDGKRVAGAFLLNEHGRLLNKYSSPFTHPPQADGTYEHEHVVLETTHTCAHMNFVARIWRTPTVFGETLAHSSTEPDQVTMTVFRIGGPGQASEVLYQLRPVAFHPSQSSILIDAGVVDPLPQGDIRITVERPSRKQIITTIFRRQALFSSTAGFPGVPINQQGDFNLRTIIAGTEDEHQLQHYVTAYMARTNVEQAGPALPQASAQASSIESPHASAVPSSQSTSPTLSERSCNSENNAFQTLLSNAPAGIETDSSAAASPAPAQAAAQAAASSSPTWSALTRAASSIAPVRAPPSGAGNSPTMPNDSPPAKDGSPMDISTPSQLDVVESDQTVLNTTAEEAATNDEGSHITAPLCNLMDEICGVLDVADKHMQQNPWADDFLARGSHIEQVDQSVQTDQLPQASQMVGVSYNDGANARMPEGTSAKIVQPLVLPSGSGTPAVTLSNDEAMPSGDANASSQSGRIATAVASLSINAGNSTDDVQMEDSERSQPGGNAQGNRGDAARQIDATTTGTSSGSPAAPAVVAQAAASAGKDSNPPITQPDTTHDNEVQYVSCNTAAAPQGDTQATHGGAPGIPSSSESDIPLAHLRSTPPLQPDDSISVAGSMAVARRARSRMAIASQAAGSVLVRRAGTSRVSASPAPSMRSARSTRSALAPGSTRVNQLLEYLMNLVANDKLKDDQRCLQLSEQRARDTSVYDEARKKYEHDMSTNDMHMQMTRAQLDLKHDTIRLLRSQYRADASEARFRSKTTEGSRIGSERRGRSRSRVTDRAHSVAGVAARMAGRMTAPPSVVSPSLIKRERIDLTRDEDDDVGTSRGAGASSSRLNSRAASIARSVMGDRSAGAGAARTTPIKIGNVNDLLRNPPVRAKRSTSTFEAARSRGATPAAERIADTRPAETGSKAINEWMATIHRSHAASRAATPAPTATRPAIDAEMMPPPRTPLVPRGQVHTPIVIGDDDETAKQRRRSVSRAPSVASHVHRAAQRQPSVPVSGTAVAPTQIDDDDSDSDDEEPLFLGRGRSASVATSRFSELIGP